MIPDDDKAEAASDASEAPGNEDAALVPVPVAANSGPRVRKPPTLLAGKKVGQ